MEDQYKVTMHVIIDIVPNIKWWLYSVVKITRIGQTPSCNMCKCTQIHDSIEEIVVKTQFASTMWFERVAPDSDTLPY